MPLRNRIAPSWIALLVFAPLASGADKALPPPSKFEKVPGEEATQIANIMRLTVEQLKRRYPGDAPAHRGVHPKDHGCVSATFEVLDTLPDNLKVGVFAKPGSKYPAWVRYSNASVLVGPDSGATPVAHGSRGMAIKLMGVTGTPLIEPNGAITQDFLMINQPVFAFANVEDYEALSQVLLKDKDNPTRFFKERIHLGPDGKPDMTDPVTARTLRTFGITQRIKSASTTATPPAYQDPPVSPVDNQYFSAAPYLLGPDQAMKFSARPVAPQAGTPDVSDPNYLRKALLARLTGDDATPVVFDFLVQVRNADDLAGKLETDIEDACFEWDATKYPWVPVARVTIKPQDFDTDDQKAKCEALFFTPWHGLVEHQPIGGINRLKLGVYQMSSQFRHFPKEPSGMAD